jgi:phage gp29-like protein
MGYTPKKEYIEKTYSIQVEDKKENSIIPNSKFYLAKDTLHQDELDVQSTAIDTKKELTFQKQILKIVENSSSYEEIYENLLEIYPDMNTKDLEDMLFKNLANSAILAQAEIEEENPDG